MSETTTVAPVEVTTAPVEAVAPTPAVEVTPAPAAEVTPAPSPEPAAPPSSLLAEALKPAESPVEQPAPVEPAQENVEGQSAEPAPLPTYEAFQAPEGITLEGEKLTDFTNLLGEFERTHKADHAAVQEFGQQLINRHVAEVTRAVTEARAADMATFETMKTQWKDAVIADPEIGGNRLQTTLDSARTFIRTHGGTDAQQAEFMEVIDAAGLGNHPAVIRLLARAGAAMSEGRPLVAKPAPLPLSRTEKMYGSRGR